MFWIGVLSTGILPVIYKIVVCTLIERISVLERHSIATRIPGTMMNILQVVLSTALAWPIAKLWEMTGIGQLITIPLWRWLEPLGAAGDALQFLTLIVIADFLAYWRHRAEHAWFWPIHAVHHAPTELYAANDIGHPVQVWFSLLFISIPMSVIQFDGPETPIAVGFIVSLLSYYIHSPVDVHFGPFRKVLVDNRFHRIHHSLEERHFDKNFGICVSIWDRLFRTAYDPAPEEWPDVAVANLPPPRSLSEYLRLPLRVVRDRQSAQDHKHGAEATVPCMTCATSSPES